MLSALACLRQRATQSCRAHSAGNLRPIADAQWRRLCAIRYLHRDSTVQTKEPEYRRYGPGKRRSNVAPETRLQEVVAGGFTKYPRVGKAPTSIGAFKRAWLGRLSPGEAADGVEYTVNGRIYAVRTASSKLCFIDLVSQPGTVRLQVYLDENKLVAQHVPMGIVKEFRKLIRDGDHISVTGKPYVTKSGDLSILATSIPEMMSPCLHSIPYTTPADAQDDILDKHVQLLAAPSLMKSIVARAHLIEAIENFLKGQAFRRVYTPILAASAGGATARPFKTTATEFSDRELTLRISPELWLKRLIVGGMNRIFEIGPSFRNEGLDKTHNPEFTTCEFYATDWPLERLMTETQKMIHDVAGRIMELSEEFPPSIGEWPGELWPQIDFIPAVNTALGLELPDLSSPTAREEVLEIFKQKDLPIPQIPTLPRLLDKLSSLYLEPRCSKATWITNLPECLSPLAKSFSHPDLPHQRVAARGELFIHCKEVVNCYEEENSPVEQKRKLIDQQKHAHLPQEGDADDIDDEAMDIDHDYIRCLEWGLPPTGGWGCGIDRLLMLMLGESNIKDVLTFGNLRAVTRGAERLPPGIEPWSRARVESSGDATSKSTDMPEIAPADDEVSTVQNDAAIRKEKTEREMKRKDHRLEQTRLQEELEEKFKDFKL